MSIKKRSVVLFGAGAVIDWQGQKTDELTTLIVALSETDRLMK